MSFDAKYFRVFPKKHFKMFYFNLFIHHRLSLQTFNFDFLIIIIYILEYVKNHIRKFAFNISFRNVYGEKRIDK